MIKSWRRPVIIAVFLYCCLSFNYTLQPTEFSLAHSLVLNTSLYGVEGLLYVAGLSYLVKISYNFLGEEIEIRRNVLLLGISVIFAVLNVSSLFVFWSDSLPTITIHSLLVFVLLVIAWAYLFFLFSKWATKVFDWLSFKNTYVASKNKVKSWFEGRFGIKAFFVILLGWLPWIISYYPASMEWDVYDPIMRYLGLRSPSNHHPWFYTCIIGAAYKFGVDIGNKNVGVFIYILLMALCMAAIYARCVSVLRKNGGKPKVYYLCLLFYALTPVWGAYAKHAFKDSIGAALFSWFIVSLVETVKDLSREDIRIKSYFEVSLSGLLSSLFRNNSVYVVIPTTIILLVILLFKKRGRKAAILLLLGLIIFQGYKHVIVTGLGVAESSPREALSIPFQQTARAVKQHPYEISDEEREEIAAVLNYDTLGVDYDPLISDPVKDKYHGGDNMPISYLATWLKMFFKYPGSYIEAFLGQSSGYYAFTPEYTERQRFGPGSHANVGMTIFNWVKDGRFESDFTCDYYEGFEPVRRALDDWAKIWHHVPVLNITDIKPLYTWLIILMGVRFFKDREYLKELPIFSCLLMVLTCCASPVNDCFRYFAPVAASFPALISLLLF
ncbi:MAG: hypothetical protein IJ091_05295 [Oscillospiraceae bacterium]|nr:hypothetical protein [Oscillospiraceae bacterium]